MKIGVIGHKGYVGSGLVRLGVTPVDCDVTSLQSVQQALEGNDLDVLICSAGITDVAYCEANQNEAFRVNVHGISNVLRWYTKGKIIYLSTDHVFPDNSAKLWLPMELTDRKPVNTYGMTKMMGEEMIRWGTATAYVVRTSKLFSYETIKEDLLALKNGEQLEFTNVIKRSFCHLDHFLEGLMYFIEHIKDMPEILHIAGSFSESYYGLWSYIGREFDIPAGQIKSRDHKIPGDPRPFKGGLSVKAAQRMKVPIYSYADGVKLLKDEK